MGNKLTYLQAFNATSRFLDLYYHRILSNNIGDLLGDMVFFRDGVTVDPAIWHDWTKNVEKIKHEESLLTSMQAFDVMIKFLEWYFERAPFQSDDVSKLLECLIEMQNDPQHIGWKHWQTCIEYVEHEEDSRVYLKLTKK